MAAITNEIYIGKDKNNPDFYFLNSEIVSVNAVNSVDLVAEELAIDSLEAVIQYHVDRGEAFVPTNASGIVTNDSYLFCGHQSADLRLVPFGTPVWYYSGEHYIGQYYVDHIERIGKDQYRLKAVSLIGIFDKKPYYGGVYDAASNTTFGSLVRDIFLSDGTQVLQGLDSARFYGYYVIRAGSQAGQDFHMSWVYNGIGEHYGALPTGYSLWLWGTFLTEIHSGAETNKYNCVYAAPSSDPTAADYDGSINLRYGRTSIDGSKSWNTSSIRVSPGDAVDISIINSRRVAIINGQEFHMPDWDPYYEEACALFGLSRSYLSRDNNNNLVAFLAPSLLDCTLLDYTETEIFSGKSSKLVPYRTVNGTDVDVYLSGKTKNVYIYPGAQNKPTPGNDIQIDLPGFVWHSEQDKAIFDSVKFDVGIKDYPVYGWLPVTSKRDALYQLMFAFDVNIVKTADDAVMFTWIYAAEPQSIPDNRIYDQGEVVYDSLAKSIELTEHSFTKTSGASEKVLFDNSAGDAEDILVTFPEPMHSLTATGLTIEFSSANFARVSGTGTLSGVPYVHSTNVKTRFCADNPGGSTVSVTDDALVGVHNSENVMKRLYDYYTKRQTVKNSIVLDGEECGRNYAFLDPFSDRSRGYIRRIDISGSAILKADCEIITDYEPTGQGSNYSHSVLLTGSGTWDVPKEVYQKDVPSIRVFIIGGGNGGNSGLKGKDGKQYRSNSQTMPAGGPHGNHGDGGKIYSVTIENPQRSFTYACGAGGKGAPGMCYSESIQNLGSPGGVTRFGSYSSDWGMPNPDGVTNFQNGKVYGKRPTGERYGDGAGGYVFLYEGLAIHLEGSGAFDYAHSLVSHGGANGSAKVSLVSGQWQGVITGGFGGGAGVGENGHDGAKPSSNNWDTVYIGNGGNGGNATIKAPNATEYGCGGYGGYGGGGGGNSGYFVGNGVTVVPGTPGVGGYGGEGGDGAPGCILIYY